MQTERIGFELMKNREEHKNMGHEKMLAVMDEVNSLAAEREELVECIALALLSRKNLFILGDTGQAKSYCINEFRKRITAPDSLNG